MTFEDSQIEEFDVESVKRDRFTAAEDMVVLYINAKDEGYGVSVRLTAEELKVLLEEISST